MQSIAIEIALPRGTAVVGPGSRVEAWLDGKSQPLDSAIQRKIALTLQAANGGLEWDEGISGVDRGTISCSVGEGIYIIGYHETDAVLAYYEKGCEIVLGRGHPTDLLSLAARHAGVLTRVIDPGTTIQKLIQAEIHQREDLAPPTEKGAKRW